MLRVYSYIAHQHNLLLVFLAVAVCLLGALTALTAFQQAVHNASRRPIFILISALASGLGIWSSHFIVMLAYEPGFSISYDVPRALLSLLVAIVISGIGWTVALSKRPTMAPLGGAIIGGGVAGMHFLAMSAVQIAGDIVWDQNYVVASIVLGIGLAALAIWLHGRKPKDPDWGAGSLLTLAICGLHFTAMTAAIIYPHQVRGVPPESVGGQTLAIIVTVAALLILIASGSLHLHDRRLFGTKLAEAQHRAALADEILRGAAERERLTAELRHQVEISAAALDNMAQGLSMHDADDRLVIHNRRFSELYKVPDQSLPPGTTLPELRNLLIAAGLLQADAAFDSAPRPRGEVKMRKDELRLLDGRIIEVYRRSLPGGGWVATHDDVTEAHKASQQIAYLAAHDTLTGLPNRVTFAEHLDGYARSGTRFAVHSIDLDRFKEVNDTLGHPVGDQILKDAAARLRKVVGDDIVTRLGGDEFAVIQKDVGDADLPAALASRIIEQLSEPFEFDGHTIVIGASVGISLAPIDGTDGDELLKMSDLALYCAKDASRGTYRFFERGMDSRLSERRQIEADLRVAIREGQFEVHYQPLLDMISGRIAGFEALVRWHHPSRGLIAPADFIATAEDTGLIIPIGEWVLRQACRDAAGWPEDVSVSVNLSPAQFKRGDLIAMTTNALAAARLSPARLELEITESVLLHDEAWVRSTLDRLTALGVRIAMDDFGTGYSSLSYLRSFPFTKIKIDRSFIVDLVGTTDALSIVQATIQLSQKLGMQVTAEGVETAEQMQILADEGCTQAQGYHVSRPVPVLSVPALLSLYNAGPNIGVRAAG